ncbi:MULTISPECIES: hypothetical protein [Caballeronia]|uniref:hypothetical protein n=1 Tax=Caballeronia TaxID=1827195 RepID=UPI000A7052C0|nr:MULTISPECIES: hypothetical protein [Caballeronia]MCE4546333.1 hypothetical protein [Caballeronia sp. PC1]MCE4573192.1 hypothetical protein [Caballeronia sp. CLC5]
MKFERDKDMGLFALGGIAAAWPFRDEFPLARPLDADFPVLTATLDHLDYVALDVALNANTPVSLTSEVVPHSSATLHHLTFKTSELHVHWLSDANTPELWAAMQSWRSRGESAFALLLPDTAPCNCIFGMLDFNIPSQTASLEPRKGHSEPNVSQDLLVAMVAVGNRLKRAVALGEDASSHRHSVNLLLPGSMEKHLGLTSSVASGLQARQGTFTRH